MTTEYNYFTCTLGEAALWKKSLNHEPDSYETVLDLIDSQARDCPDAPALGFADFTGQSADSRACKLGAGADTKSQWDPPLRAPGAPEARPLTALQLRPL